MNQSKSDEQRPVVTKLSKFTFRAWLMCLRRSLPKMIVSGIVVGVFAAIKSGKTMDLLLLAPLGAVLGLGTVGTLVFGTISWIFAPQEFTLNGGDMVDLADKAVDSIDAGG